MPYIKPIARSPLLPLQVSLFNLLDSQLSVPVFDFVPEDQPYPYVVMGECTETPDNEHNQYGSETTHMIHVWTEYEGFSQGLLIADEITQLLDHQQRTLEVDGHHVVSIRHEMTRTMLDPDPKLRHVPVQYRICTEQDPGGE